ncbi:MAG: hypothetical protein ACRDPF_21530 [Streptosporangiaceae bacterium]
MLVAWPVKTVEPAGKPVHDDLPFAERMSTSAGRKAAGQTRA